jgi:hypothetical protein
MDALTSKALILLNGPSGRVEIEPEVGQFAKNFFSQKDWRDMRPAQKKDPAVVPCP